MDRRRFTGIGAVASVLVLLHSTCVWADAGTPLMWSVITAILVINPLIAAGEAFLAWLVLRQPRWIWWFVVLLVANYSSYIGGALAIAPAVDFLRSRIYPGQLLFTAPSILWAITLLSYPFTIFVEWPFCALALRRRRLAVPKGLLLSTALQTCSYAVIMVFWLPAYGMYGEFTVLHTPTNVHMPAFELVYVDGRTVYQQKLDGSERRRIAESSFRASAPSPLFVSDQDGESALYLAQRTDPSFRISNIGPYPIDKDVWGAYRQAAPFEPPGDLGVRPRYRAGYATEIDYRVDGNSGWGVTPAGPWPTMPYIVYGGGDHLLVGLESPAILLLRGPAYLLPGKQFVGSLDRCIVLVDVERRTVSLLAEGDAFLVLPDAEHARKLLASRAKSEEGS